MGELFLMLVLWFVFCLVSSEILKAWSTDLPKG